MCVSIQNDNQPKISVIIPVYNAGKYLDRCISSVVNQSYKNLEIVLVDDGSNDNSGNICDKWKGIDSRIQVIHKKNEGPGVARNEGLKIIKGGRYVTFVDSDDWIEIKMYEHLIEIAIETNSDIVGCASVVDYQNGTHKENYTNIQEGIIDKDILILNILESNKNAWGAVHNKIFKIELFDNICFPAVKHLEDYVVTTKLFNEANAIYFCPVLFYHHTFNTESLSMSRWNPIRLTIPNTVEQIISYLQKNNNNSSILKATYRFRFMTYVDILWLLNKSEVKEKKCIKSDKKKEVIRAFIGWLLHSKKKKKDIKLVVKFILLMI